ncbi:SSS family transporter [Prosthecobacter fusiformis]|uniref:SSS family transporter n=1 Tax=Prosthecobacter fusiformis TaxID=48464 RepID=A0A4R7RZJ6_9BACT|nr:sodium:solute symporter [Prosthecobacter fusiformis]TDU71362.1 SSS family transporter [Prosthecobacter fusiformis]
MPYIIDALVILAYFGIIISIGLSQRSKSGSMEGFTLGDRQIAWWAVLASILAAEISAGTFFGAPGEGYALRNYTYIQLMAGYLLARLVVSAVFIPAYYRYGVVSVYEFLGIRFGPLTRRWASGIFLVTRLLASGSRLWVPTVILVLGWKLYVNPNTTPMQEFWLYAGALVGITVLTAIYTTLGGIRAVIWTDVIQIGVLFSALGFALWYLLGHTGGWAALQGAIQEPAMIDWGSPDPAHPGAWGWVKGILETEYTIWAAFIGSTFVTLATHGTDQDMVQRMLTAKNKRQSGMATILSGVCDIPVNFMVLSIGILLYVYFQANPSELLPKNVKGTVDSSQVFPYFILNVMPQGLRGLVVAGVLATAMGSLSTALNSLATSYARDFHFRWFGEPSTDAGQVRVLRFSTVLFAVLLIGVALATAWVKAHNPSLRIIPIILGVFGYTYGSLLGVFMVGLFTKTRGNDLGNGIGMLAGFIVVAYLSGLDQGLAATLGMGEGISRPDWMPIVEFPWRIFFGTVVTFAVAVLFPTSLVMQRHRYLAEK